MQTGLVIGAKSLKNYSLHDSNPSVATLDTLARYVLDAPYTDEINRKDNESHHPYWHQYRSRFSQIQANKTAFRFPWKKLGVSLLILFAIVTGLTFLNPFSITKQPFLDNFNALSEDSLRARGWMIKSPDPFYWAKRNEQEGYLTLYTLRGDNWSLGKNKAGIHNLLMRKIDLNCFMVEIRLSDFIPENNWQQAGIILSEDSTFTGKMLRLSISYNDFFGGYEKPAEIIVQTISSAESGKQSKPEEIAHYTLFILEEGKENLAEENLSKSALKIEKTGNHYRFLYSASSMESFAFKEVVSRDLNLSPKYVSIFSIQGWADSANFIPVKFDSFGIFPLSCKN